MVAIRVLGQLWRRLSWALLTLFTWMATATAGYSLIEGWPWFDALYMTVITIFTVGYQEVLPLTDAGRIWTIVVIATGFLIIASVAAELAGGPLASLWRESKLERDLSRLHDHYIICGLGRVGWQVALGLRQQGVVFGVIDPQQKHIDEFREWNVPYLIGDATEDTVLRQMGIERARGLVAAASTDAINIYVVLTARGINPDLAIAARAEEPSAESKLHRAGANHVLAPTALGGRRLATLLVRPALAEYIESVLAEMHIITEEVELEPGSSLCKISIADMQERIGPEHQGPAVLAIRPADAEEFIPHPPRSRELAPGDVLIASGREEDVDQLRDLSH